MPVFLERLILPILAAAVITVILLNPFKLDRQSQLSLFIAVLAVRYFVAHAIHKTNQAQKTPMTRATSPSESSAQIMISRIVLVPVTNSGQASILEVFLDNRGSLAAHALTMNSVASLKGLAMTQEEERQGILLTRFLPSQPDYQKDIQPGDTNFRIAIPEAKITAGLQKPFYYYVFLRVVYRDKAHERQHWVTEYGAVAINGFDVWNPCGNRRIFLEDD